MWPFFGESVTSLSADGDWLYEGSSSKSSAGIGDVRLIFGAWSVDTFSVDAPRCRFLGIR